MVMISLGDKTTDLEQEVRRIGQTLSNFEIKTIGDVDLKAARVQILNCLNQLMDLSKQLGYIREEAHIGDVLVTISNELHMDIVSVFERIESIRKDWNCYDTEASDEAGEERDTGEI